MEEKLRAWQMAMELVEPIIEKHGLETYKTGAPNIFAPPTATFTAVDQHIDNTIRVADWLMGVNQ